MTKNFAFGCGRAPVCHSLKNWTDSHGNGARIRRGGRNCSYFARSQPYRFSAAFYLWKGVKFTARQYWRRLGYQCMVRATFIKNRRGDNATDLALLKRLFKKERLCGRLFLLLKRNLGYASKENWVAAEYSVSMRVWSTSMGEGTFEARDVM